MSYNANDDIISRVESCMNPALESMLTGTTKARSAEISAYPIRTLLTVGVKEIKFRHADLATGPSAVKFVKDVVADYNESMRDDTAHSKITFYNVDGIPLYVYSESNHPFVDFGYYTFNRKTGKMKAHSMTALACVRKHRLAEYEKKMPAKESSIDTMRASADNSEIALEGFFDRIPKRDQAAMAAIPTKKLIAYRLQEIITKSDGGKKYTVLYTSEAKALAKTALVKYNELMAGEKDPLICETATINGYPVLIASGHGAFIDFTYYRQKKNGKISARSSTKEDCMMAAWRALNEAAKPAK